MTSLAIKVKGIAYGIQGTIEKKLLKANGKYDIFVVLRDTKDVIWDDI